MAAPNFRDAENMQPYEQLKNAYKRIDTFSGKSSPEVEELRRRTKESMEALVACSSEEKDTMLKNSLLDTYKQACEYQRLKKNVAQADGVQNTGSSDWRPAKKTGRERFEGAEDIKKIISAMYPDDTQKIDGVFASIETATKNAKKLHENNGHFEAGSSNPKSIPHDNKAYDALAVMYTADALARNYAANKNMNNLTGEQMMSTIVTKSKDLTQSKGFQKATENMNYQSLNNAVLKGPKAVRENLISSGLSKNTNIANVNRTQPDLSANKGRNLGD